MENWKENVSFVLVEPKESGNIGASARAIKNMGFMNLSLVNPPSQLTDEARWFACNALDVLESAQTYPDFRSAVADKAIVVGTSRRTGKRRGMILPLEQGAKKIIERAKAGKVAILFGREAKGLLNEEVDECGLLLTIPTSKEHRSLNLSQAVMIVAYELLKAGYESQGSVNSVNKEFISKTPSPSPSGGEGNNTAPPLRGGDEGEGGVCDLTNDRLSNKRRTRNSRQKPSPRMFESGEYGTQLVSYEEISTLYSRMTEILKLLEYIPRGDRDLEAKIMQNLKHFIARSGLTEWELNMLHGILTQIEKKVKQHSIYPAPL
ncbi:MAG: RNA methyltransferase [Nitrospirae bacterium]|nr:RNA methyltransferase [Nitrospirota bacterium]